MIYELRVYYAMPGRLPDLIKRFEDVTLKIWDKNQIKQVGFWTDLIGTSSQKLTYMLAWDSLADREHKWNTFYADKEWIEAKAETEKSGTLVSNVENSILKPTSYSALK